MGEFIERRRLPRISIRWPVMVYTPTGEVMGETRDITSTGAYVQCVEPLKVTEQYWLQMGVPSRPLMLKGEVIWTGLITDKYGKHAAYAGIFVIHIAEEDRQILREAILEGGV